MVSKSSAFIIQRHDNNPIRRQTHLHAKKQSMAQRRKSRAKRIQHEVSPYSRLPPPKVRADQEELPVSSSKEELETAKTLAETDTKAKQLLRSQRESVDMLKFFRERVESLDASALFEALDGKGYCCIDNFLASEDVVKKIELEGKSLFENELMQGDMNAIGLGEYVTSIKGGQDQYQQCPRSIEFVVSATKHFPGELDKTKTMATMRTFSRNSWLASLRLLTGSDKDDDNEQTLKPFRTVINDDADARRISMAYYAVPAGWEFGGGLTFGDNPEETLATKRDRLVVWKSDLPFRQQAWKGSKAMPFASCIELHLVQ
jgi:hypothetical protein